MRYVLALSLILAVVGSAYAGGGCRSFSSSAVVVQSAPVCGASVAVAAAPAFVVQSHPVLVQRQFVAAAPAAVAVQSFGAQVFASGGGASVAGLGAAASGSRRAVIRRGGIRGLIFGDVIRAR